MIKPNRLKKGDTIGIIAPSGAIKDISMLETAIDKIKQRGYKVKEAPHLRDRKWYLAGEDNNRAEDLMNFFADPDINAIFCARGGYGCARLLDKLNYSVIKQNPKILLGFSDITALHLAINKYSELITFHGPLIVFDLGKNKNDPYTVNNLWNTLESPQKPKTEVQNACKPITVNPGKVKGRLIGGNLAVICSLLGSQYIPDITNTILFIEDTSEYLYRLDRYLIQLKLSSILTTVSGIIFGDFSQIVKTEDTLINKLTVMDLISDIMKDINTPAIYGFSCGHDTNKATLPIGAECELDCTNGILTIVESFVGNS